MINFFWRLAGALTLRADTYEEIEHDGAATAQAAVVVLLSSLAAGVGVFRLSHNPGTLVFVSALAFAAWILWTILTLEIGRWILPEPQTQVSFAELLRTIGFSSAPGIFRIAGLIPGRTTVVFVITAVWMLLAMIVAVRQALDFLHTRRAILVCLLGWLLAGSMAVVIGLLFGPQLSGGQ